MPRFLPRNRILLLALSVLVGLSGCDTPAAPTPPPSACQYAATPVEFTPCMSSPGELFVAVSATPGCPWSAGVTVPWIAVTAGSSGTGPAIIRFRISDNWDAPREGFVTVRGALPGQAADVRVAQAGCRYWVGPDALAFSVAGGAGTFDVLQQSEPITCGGPRQNACQWSAVPDVAWIAITTSMPRTGDDRVSFVVAPNVATVDRTGTIVVRDKVVRIAQSAR